MAASVVSVQAAGMKTEEKEELVHCFVCDMLVTGRFYSLATSRAQTSKTRLIEKLGSLVGDQYMVVISEDDVICRACATYMNTLDRLESEALSIRSIVLKLLEKKYSLSEGELVNQKNTGLSQPPRIVPSQNTDPEDIKPVSQRGSFMARKRKAALAQFANTSSEEQENMQHTKKPTGKWMQCGTCKYTTSYDSFMHNHVRDELAAKEDVAQPHPRANTKAAKLAPVKPVKKIIPKAKFPSHIIDETSQDSEGSETVEMIAAEISDYAVGKSTPMVSGDQPETIKVQIVSQGQSRKKNFGNNQNEVTIELPEIHESDVDLDNAEVITGDNDDICVMLEEPSADDHLMKMSEGDNTVYVQMVGVDKDASSEPGMSKQVLTVADDGTVEMVEVMWDEMAATSAEGGEQF